MSDNADPFPALGSVYKTSDRLVSQLSQNVADISLNSAQGGDYKANSCKSQNRVVASPWVPQNSTPSAWGHPKVIQKLGMQNNGRSGTANSNVPPTQTADSKIYPGSGTAWPLCTNEAWKNNYLASQSALSLPPKHGWNWSTQAGTTHSSSWKDGHDKDKIISDAQFGDVDDDKNGTTDNDDDSDIVYDSDDNFLDDDSDSDGSQKSHGTRKKCKWFKAFFESFDKLAIEEINSPERRWRCPACQEGPGAIDWYRGLMPLMTHAKTKKNQRAKLHREFAELLDEEMCKWGTSVMPVGEAFGRWEGLTERVKDFETVWPPMIFIMNTRYEKDENEKWIGMGNQELLDYFSSYAALKARHSYGPKGHRGMSVLIFESSAAGYLEAARLHKHFKEQGRDRDAWDCHRVPFCPGGKRQLYGYMALKEDLDIFNQHSQGKSKLKYEMRSYQEMVESKIKQINEDSQKVIRLKDKVAKEQMQSQALADSLSRVNDKLQKKMEEIHIVRQRTKLLNEQNKEEMDAQEHFFTNQIKAIHQAIYAKEDNFEKLLQEERKKVEQSNVNTSTIENEHRVEKIATFVKFQDKEMEEFEAKREELIKSHEDKKAAIMRRYWAEHVELEKEFENELTRLMETYTPNRQEVQTANSL